MELTINWTGTAMRYGNREHFFCVNTFGVELAFSVYVVPTEYALEHSSVTKFRVEIAREKSTKTITRDEIIHGKVNSIHIVKTSEEFEERFNHSYNILKLVTDRQVLNIGAYQEISKSNSHPYTLCTTEFTNLLAESVEIKSASQLNGTDFARLKCLIEKKDLAKELLCE